MKTLFIDGTEGDNFTLSGDGTNAPFWLFDPDKQDWVSGPYQSRQDAELALSEASK